MIEQKYITPLLRVTVRVVSKELDHWSKIQSYFEICLNVHPFLAQNMLMNSKK